jgi:hypothetical protein
MKSFMHNYKQLNRTKVAREEQGMSMVIALMMGMILTVDMPCSSRATFVLFNCL